MYHSTLKGLERWRARNLLAAKRLDRDHVPILRGAGFRI
jgi:hypothetical protein